MSIEEVKQRSQVRSRTIHTDDSPYAPTIYVKNLSEETNDSMINTVRELDLESLRTSMTTVLGMIDHIVVTENQQKLKERKNS